MEDKKREGMSNHMEKRLIDINPIIGDLTAMKSMYDAILLDGMIKGLENAHAVDAADVLRGMWIPCSERLPEKYVDVSGDLINFMAYIPEYGVDIANYLSQAKTWFCLGVPAKVTHWMPLPEPPEDEP